MSESTASQVPATLDRAFVASYSGRLLAVWNEHDTTALPELLTDDVAWVDPAVAEPVRGVEGVRRFMQDCFGWFPDLHFEITGAFCFADDAPEVMVPWRMTGTQLGRYDPPGYASTGRRMDIEGIDVYTFRGQKVAHYRAHYNQVEVARQLGWLPARGSRGERLATALQRVQARVQARRA